MPSQGKAYTAEQKEFIVRLKHSYDHSSQVKQNQALSSPHLAVANPSPEDVFCGCA
jgi:hypothetical protein